MISKTNGLLSPAKFGGRLAILACFAAALSACAAPTSTLPTLSWSDVATNGQTRLGVLPNGLVSEPYAG